MASGPSPKKRRKPKGASFPRGIVLWAWLTAFLVLVGLIYWGRSAKPERPQTQAAAHERGQSATKASDHREAARPKETAQARPAVSQESKPGRGGAERPTLAPQQLEKPEHPAGEDRHDTNTGNLLAARKPAGDSKEPDKPPPPPQPPPLMPSLARVAIVIDDFGPSLEIAKRFLDVPLNLTFAVLPHQRFTQEIAALVQEHHRQVILHLPMEPRGYPRTNPGKGALLLSMSEAALQESLRSALDVSPHFAGINNHMGSHFTENARVMKTVLEEAKKHQLFFLDSYTSARSVASAVAQEVRIPLRRRDIFLDNNQSENAVRAQLRQVMRRAIVQGEAVAIGHPHETTLRALLKEVDAFEREKIAVVPAGELMGGS